MLGDKLTYEIPAWVAAYIGIPFDEYNCWQLICRVYKEIFNVKLCDYGNEYIDALDKENIKKIYEREFKVWQRVQEPIFGDIIVLKIEGQPWHAGMIVSQRDMLHTEHKLESVIESYHGIIWKDRIIGYYRHQK